MQGKRKTGPTQRRKMHVKKGDKVVVISGPHRSKEPAEVLRVDPDSNRVVVKGVNIRIKHERKSPQHPQGGRVEKEFPIHASNVLLWSAKAKKGVRVHRELVDGKRVRVGTCGTKFD